MAGGVPFEISTIGVCDGIAMNHDGMHYSLVSREVVADSVECAVQGHAFDALVCIPNCDKVVPGMLLGALRVNIPTVFVSGGPMLAGARPGGRGPATDLNTLFDGAGRVQAGTMTEEELKHHEDHACPTCGSCSGMFTANSMNCLCEALGIALPGNGTIPAVYSERIRLAKHAGMKVMELLEKGLRARDIVSAAAIRNAMECDMAFGGSTNTVLHLIRISIGHPITMDDWDAASARTPHLVKLAPSGPRPPHRPLRGWAACRWSSPSSTSWGSSIAAPSRAWGRWTEYLDHMKACCAGADGEVVRAHDNPFSPGGRFARAARQHRSRRRRREEERRGPLHAHAHGPRARVRGRGGTPARAINAGRIEPGDVVVIRYEGPKGGPGMREMLTPTSAICGMGLSTSVALITDGALLRRHEGPGRGACEPRGRGGAAPSRLSRRATSSRWT